MEVSVVKWTSFADDRVGCLVERVWIIQPVPDGRGANEKLLLRCNCITEPMRPDNSACPLLSTFAHCIQHDEFGFMVVYEEKDTNHRTRAIITPLLFCSLQRIFHRTPHAPHFGCSD